MLQRFKNSWVSWAAEREEDGLGIAFRQANGFLVLDVLSVLSLQSRRLLQTPHLFTCDYRRTTTSVFLKLPSMSDFQCHSQPFSSQGSKSPSMLPCHLSIIFVFKKTYINQQTLEAETRLSGVAPDKFTGTGKTLTLALTKSIFF